MLSVIYGYACGFQTALDKIKTYKRLGEELAEEKGWIVTYTLPGDTISDKTIQCTWHKRVSDCKTIHITKEARLHPDDEYIEIVGQTLALARVIEEIYGEGNKLDQQELYLHLSVTGIVLTAAITMKV